MARIYDAFLSFSFILIVVFFARVLYYTKYMAPGPDNFTYALAITSPIIVIGLDVLFIIIVLIAKQKVPVKRSLLSIGACLACMLLYVLLY